MSSSDLGKNENQISSICHIQLPSGTYDLPGCEYVWNRTGYIMDNFHSYPSYSWSDQLVWLSISNGTGHDAVYTTMYINRSRVTTLNFPNYAYYRYADSGICKYVGYCNSHINLYFNIQIPKWSNNGNNIGNDVWFNYSGEFGTFQIMQGYSGVQGFNYNFKINGRFNYRNGTFMTDFYLWFLLPTYSQGLSQEPFTSTWIKIGREEYSISAISSYQFANINSYISTVCTTDF